MRFTVLMAILLTLTTCGKPLWRVPLPTLSDEPMPAGWPLERGIYSLVLAPEQGRTADHPVKEPVILAESTTATHFDLGGQWFINRRWPDSVKVGFSAAFADLWHRSQRPPLISPTVVHGLPIQFGSSAPQVCLADAPPWCLEGATHVTLSPIGFNGDSTYAVVSRRTWCGPLCGTGTLFLLRRKVGARWVVWTAYLLWVS